jgi:hypothetical protein
MWCKILSIGSLLGNIAIGTALVVGGFNAGVELDLGSVLADGRTAIVNAVGDLSNISADLTLSVGDSSDTSDPSLVDAEVEVNALGADARVELDLQEDDPDDGTSCDGSLLTSLLGIIPDIDSGCNGK